jgi:uncharacterized membrane protein YbhN (UPF0104 family)
MMPQALPAILIRRFACRYRHIIANRIHRRTSRRYDRVLGPESGETKISRRKLPAWVPQVAGYTISIGCLAWVLHGYDLRSIWSGIKELEWPWVSLCVVFDLLVYVCHGWRWNLVLRPVKRLPLWRTVQAIYIGLFANEILPLRTGEVIRCYLLAHWSDLFFSVALASIAVERLMDGVWMVSAFAVTSSFLEGKIPAYVVDVVRGVTALLFWCWASFFTWFFINRTPTRWFGKAAGAQPFVTWWMDCI